MSALTVELTGEEREFVEEQVARGLSPSPTDYVNDLIRRQRFRAEELSDDDESDDEYAAQMRERWEKAKARDPVAFQKAVDRMNELIRESIESGPSIEMTPEEWEKLWREADEYHAERRGH
jgi:Arc/MetJ-type ribon-helix-helix transcriptional regulator